MMAMAMTWLCFLNGIDLDAAFERTSTGLVLYPSCENDV